MRRNVIILVLLCITATGCRAREESQVVGTKEPARTVQVGAGPQTGVVTNQVVRTEVLVGSWGPDPGQFGLQVTGEGAHWGPSSFVIDSTGQIYVSDPFNHRVQVFGPDGSFLRGITTHERINRAMHDMCVLRDGTVYATDGWLVYKCDPGGDRFEQLSSESLEHDRQVFGIVVARKEELLLYAEQSGTRVDYTGTTWINQYISADLRHGGSAEGHDLCANLSWPRMCAILGREEIGPGAAELEVLVWTPEIGGSHSVHIEVPELTGCRATTTLVGCDRKEICIYWHGMTTINRRSVLW